jgi:tetratricopeptide repeat protein 21B
MCTPSHLVSFIDTISPYQGLYQLEHAIAGLYDLAATHPTSLLMYTVLSPCKVTTAVRTMLSGLGGEPKAATEAPSPQLSKCGRALDLLLKQVPGMMEGQLLAARVMYLNGNLDAAQRKAAEVLRTSPDAFMVHLLICK